MVNSAIATKILTIAATKVFENISKVGSKRIKGRIEQANISKACDKYIEKYEERHCKIRVLGMPKLIELESAYTSVQFIDFSYSISQSDSIDELHKKHELRRRSKGGRRTFQAEMKEGLRESDIPDELQYRLVLGEAGAGKSTYLKKIGLEALKGKKWSVPPVHSDENIFRKRIISGEKYCIPDFLELRNLVNDSTETNQRIDFKGGLVREFEICNFPCPEEFVETALSEGSLLILLDGLDEVPSTRIISTTAEIRNFVDHYSRNRFVLSSRPAAYLGTLAKFEVVKVSVLEDSQVEDFIQKWFNSQVEREISLHPYDSDNEKEKYNKLAKECWKLLSKTKIESVKELTQTPLLLNLICIAFNDNKCLPENRALLYQQALNALIKTWSREKLITPEPIYQNFNPSLEIGMLSEFAYEKFSEKIYFFARDELIEMITSFLQNNLNAQPGLDGEEILRAIEIQQGILVRRSISNYSFSHLTFQEFLAAQYISSDPRRIDGLISDHLISVRWREIFVVAAGLLFDGADELLTKMQQDSQKFISSSPNLKGLLGWAEQMTDTLENKENLLSKRAAALCIATYFADVGAQKFQDNRLKDSAVALASSKAITRTLDKRLADSAEAIRTQAVISLSADTSSIEGYRKRVNALIKGIKMLEMFQFDFVLFRANAARMSERLSDKNLDELSLSKQIWKAWLSNFKLNPRFLYLSKDEINALQRYLYITALILACKSAANRLSRKTWAEVSDKMLRAR